MLITPDAPYRELARASYSAALGDCEDLPMADGLPWRTEPGLMASLPDEKERFTLTTESLGECRLQADMIGGGGLCNRALELLGADGSTTMGAACCQCGGGRPKMAAGNETALRALVDTASIALVMACRERAPPNALELGRSCVKILQDSDVNVFEGEWSYLWSEENLYTQDRQHVVQGGSEEVRADNQGSGMSLRSCTIRCERDPQCTAFSHSAFGCLYWRNGRCSSDDAEGMRDVPQSEKDSVRSFKPCRENDACKAAAAAAAEAKTQAVDQGLSLPASLPCSSASSTTSSVPYLEEEAPCSEQYAAAFEAQVTEYWDHATALDSNVTKEDAELARIEAAYSVAGALQILANFLMYVAPWSLYIVATAFRMFAAARKPAAVHPAVGAQEDVDQNALPPGTTLFDLLGLTGSVLLCVQFVNAGIMFFSGLHTASVIYSRFQILD